MILMQPDLAARPAPINADSFKPELSTADSSDLPKLMAPVRLETRRERTTRIFQIWIMPDRDGGNPGWGARQFPKQGREGAFVPLASGAANDDDALKIRADARVLGATIKAGTSVTYTPRSADRHLYLVPATGKIRINDVEANARDGVAITALESITITALEDSEVVLVDAA